VQQGSQQTQPLAVLTDVLQRAGKPDQARETLEKLRPISQRVDLDAPAFARLAPLARSLGWPDDWRQSAAAPADIGPRPALDMLGPFRWHPAAAAAWSLPSGDGATLSLGQFQGRPLVLMFYLGSSCPHCVQQLQAFAARARAFGDAGIALAAISTESLEEFKTGAAELTKAGPLPFAVACDPAKEVFRAYRAHDDFENSPLHGTFLVDGRGQVRWQDISFEPFLDTQFLLDEARRLLSLP
jgi:peroxiredoxin